MKLGIEQNVLKVKKQTGISHYLINIINNFKYKDLDITMFTQYNRHGNNDLIRLDIDYKEENFNIFKRQTFNYLYFYSFGQRKKIKDLDVFWQSHFTQPVIFPKNVKLVSTIYDLIPFHTNNEQQSKIYNTLGKYLIKKTIYNSDQIVTISNTIKKEIVEMFNPKQPIYVVYPQLNHFQIYKDKVYEQNQKKLGYRFNLKPKEYFLSVYSIRPRKNLITLIKQYQNLDTEILKKYPLIIVGYIDDNYKEVYNELKKEQDIAEMRGGKVLFTNYISDDDLELLYNYQYLFVSPSTSEGFDMPSVEQLLHNNIVIQSNIPIHKEILGKLVYYYDTMNYIELRNIIEGIIIYGKYKRIQPLTPLYYFSHYTWKDQQDEYMRIFNDVLKNNN